jgi:RNA polymerase sigma-70 factor, ECF subfamily
LPPFGRAIWRENRSAGVYFALTFASWLHYYGGKRSAISDDRPVVERMLGHSDAELVEAARNGDVSSFGELYRRHYAAAVGIAYCALSDRHLAEDAAQEAFTIACRDLYRLRCAEKFAAWLHGICRKVARRLAKAKWRHPLPTETASATVANSDGDRATLVRQSVGRLPEKAREVVVLHYFSGLTYEQIAALLRTSPQAVHGRLLRARRNMAEDLRRNGLGRREP